MRYSINFKVFDFFIPTSKKVLTSETGQNMNIEFFLILKTN